MSLKNSAAFNSLFVNWPFFLLFISGIALPGAALFMANTLADTMYPVPVTPAAIVPDPGADQGIAEMNDRLQPLFRLADNLLAEVDDANALPDSGESDDARLFNAPASTLPVAVTGIVSSALPQHSVLIIQTHGRQYSLTAGERLPESDANVVRIFPDRAIIRHQGKYASLKMAD